MNQARNNPTGEFRNVRVGRSDLVHVGSNQMLGGAFGARLSLWFAPICHVGKRGGNLSYRPTNDDATCSYCLSTVARRVAARLRTKLDARDARAAGGSVPAAPASRAETVVADGARRCPDSGLTTEEESWGPEGDVDGWAAVLGVRPDLAPATVPGIRRVAHGLADRLDRLRACGNGVLPLVAAHAFRVLADRLEVTE